MTPANVVSLDERRARRDAEQHQLEGEQRFVTVRRVLAPNRVLTTVIPLPTRDDDGPERAA